jgi:uncharacterized protein
MLNYYRQTLGVLAFVFVSTSVTAASFDCKKAGTPVEKAICHDKELNKLDSELAKNYKNLLDALPKAEAEVLKEEQREWLDHRDNAFAHCDRDKPVDCLLYEYAIRTTVLGPLEHAGFDCKKAGTAVEKKICGSRLLSHADGRIAKIYQPLQKEFKQNQLDWLKERNEQLADPDCDLRCAWDVYQERIRFFVHQSF